MKKISVLSLSTLVLLFSSFTISPLIKGTVRSADVIIYGGTSAAITAAVQVKKMGKSVIIVSPDKHLGGLSSVVWVLLILETKRLLEGFLGVLPKTLPALSKLGLLEMAKKGRIWQQRTRHSRH